MTRDASLDEFMGGEAGDGDAADADGRTESDSTTEAAPGDEGSDEAAGAGDDESAATAEANPSSDGEADEADEVADSATPAVSAAEATPATVTMAWSPAGADCAACGATVERRWQDEAGLVCPDCKEW
jgi:rubrerythrin